MTEGPVTDTASAAQRGIWFHELLDACGSVYHLPFTVTLTGDLDVGVLRLACTSTVQRHPVLGCAVTERDGVPYLVPALREPELVVESLEDSNVDVHVLAPFDLIRGPLCRMILQIAGNDQHRLLVVAHHLVFDGPSIELFVKDVAAFYSAEIERRAPDLAPLPPPAPAHAWTGRIDSSTAAARQYWSDHTIGGGDDLVLPGLDHVPNRPQVAAAVEIWFPDSMRESLAALEANIGVTRFELAVASLHVLMYRYGNELPATALDLGTRGPDQRDRIGMFVNELPLASAPVGSESFADFAQRVRSDLRELYRVRSISRAQIGTALRPSGASAPLSFTFVTSRRATPAFSGLVASAVKILFNQAVRGALRIQLFDGADGLRAVVQYPTQSITREDAESIGRHWMAILDQVTGDAGTALDDLVLLDLAERERLLVTWNDTAVQHPDLAVPALVAAQAARNPDAVAVVQGQRRLTYAELIGDAHRLASRLRAQGLTAGSRVAVRVTRTERLIVGLLAVLEVGAAFVPIDGNYPQQRRDFIAADSGVSLELRDFDLCHVGETIDCVSAVDGPRTSDLAYVIYTSGSSGRPKGVQVEHSALTNLLLSMRDLLGARPDDVWLAMTSVSFDISILELFLPLVTGASVVVASEDQTRDGLALCDLIRRHGITHVQATPTGWSMLLEAGFDAAQVTALCGGEALLPALAQQVRARVSRLVNVYGPTETTIWSTADEIDVEVRSVTIGRPLANTRLFVLDEHGAVVPIGLPGELYIGGSGLARGYRGLPELDRERFLPDPFGSPGQRLYRTGDRVRYRHDGRLEFLGRADGQIKLRGYRIELGEVESHLLAAVGVDQAVAAVQGNVLVGYYVGRATAGDVRRQLAATLPAYMVPEFIVELDALPTTPNGKCDRQALPMPSATTGAGSARDAGLLETIREIWCEVLRLPDLDASESLFDLGGSSVTMAQITARIRDRIGVDVPLHAYFDRPTVQGIAMVVDGLRARERIS